jgi:hypothetical protein
MTTYALLETFDKHLEKLEGIFQRLKKVGPKVNATKSFFAHGKLEYLGYWITQDGILGCLLPFWFLYSGGHFQKKSDGKRQSHDS